MGGSLVIGSCSGNFYVLDRYTGELRWQYDIHQDGKQTSFHGDPLVTPDGLVLLGTDLSCAPEGIGHVYAFDIKNKTVKWKQKFVSGITTPIAESDGALFFGGVRDTWYKADTRTGNITWEYQASESNQCGVPRAPIIVAGKVFLVAQDGIIHVIDTVSGKLVQKIQPPSRPETALVRYDEAILFGAADGAIYTLNPTSFDLKPFMHLEGTPTGRIRITNERLVVFIRKAEHRGAVVFLNPSTRKVEWTNTAESEWSSDVPQIWKGLVLAGNCQGKLLAMSVLTGEQVWSEQLKGCIRSIGISEHVLYVGAQEGQLYAVRVPDKKTKNSTVSGRPNAH